MLAGVYFSFHSDFTLVATKLEPMLEHSITYESNEGWVSVDKGTENFSGHGIVTQYTVGQFVYVHAGYAIHFFTFEEQPMPT